MWVQRDEDEEALIRKGVAAIADNWETNTLPDRPAWAKTIERKSAELPGGGRGPCLEIDTDKERTNDHGWRCTYCSWVTTCWEGFEVVPLGKPAYRKPIETENAVQKEAK